MADSSVFDAVVFAGGGCRCIWQVGFFQTVAARMELRPRQVAAVSAGSAMACMLFADRVQEGLAYFVEQVRRNERNVYPENLWRGSPVFPHEGIYRDTILHTLDDAALERLRAGPDIRVLLARLPAWIGPGVGVGLGFLAYNVEKLLAPSVHPELAWRLGFASEVVSLSDCETPEDVADLVLHSSCTPPFTPVYERAGAPVLDGGVVDNVPVSALSGEDGRTLVLLTRRYDQTLLPRVAGRTYVQPSQSIPVEKWDYASPDLVCAALELGRRDGEAFLAEGRVNAA